MADFYIKRNDTKEAIQATLKDQAGAVDLTGAAVRFHMMDKQGAVKVDKPATLVDAPNGVVKYTWLAADTDTAGLFRAEWEVTFGDGTIHTFPNDGYVEVEIQKDVS